MFARRVASLFLVCALAHAAPADWNAAARQDTQFAIDTIRASHAGAVSRQVDVIDALETGGRAAMVEAARVQTEQDYQRVLVRFIDGFGDPHTGIDVGLATRAWAGIVLDHVDGRFRVIWSEPNWPTPLPPRGAVTQSCDGVWTGTYLKTAVAPLLNHSAEYATSASEAARKSMFENGLGYAPKGCDFFLPDGSNVHYDLPLHAIDPGHLKEVRMHYAPAPRPVGMYPLAPGMVVVSMPDFNGSKSAAAYDKLYADLAASKRPDWIVFDLRGNGGGDSSWGTRALEVLYGKEYGQRLGDSSSYSKYMIADQPTIDVFRRYASLPAFAASKQMFDNAIPKLEAALRRGDKMAQIDGTSRAQAAALGTQLRKRPGGPRLAAIIDRNCFSSCMNFIQQITAIDDTMLLGESTLGYSPYGEINGFDLPSGRGSISLPSAIYAGFQATREPFVPDLPYPGNLADDAALSKWVASTLARLKPGLKQP